MTFQALEDSLFITSGELHKFKHTVKVAVGLCKLGYKLHKIKEQELSRFKPLYDEYIASDEYKDVLKGKESQNSKDQDEEVQDRDPRGFIKYYDVVSMLKQPIMAFKQLNGKIDFTKFVDEICISSPSNAELQSSALKYFLVIGKCASNKTVFEQVKTSWLAIVYSD